MADNQPAAFDLMVALDSVIQEARVGIEGQKMNLDNSSARLGAVMRRNVEQAGTYSEVLQKILIELDAKMEDDDSIRQATSEIASLKRQLALPGRVAGADASADAVEADADPGGPSRAPKNSLDVDLGPPNPERLASPRSPSPSRSPSPPPPKKSRKSVPEPASSSGTIAAQVEARLAALPKRTPAEQQQWDATLLARRQEFGKHWEDPGSKTARKDAAKEALGMRVVSNTYDKIKANATSLARQYLDANPTDASSDPWFPYVCALFLTDEVNQEAEGTQDDWLVESLISTAQKSMHDKRNRDAQKEPGGSAPPPPPPPPAGPSGSKPSAHSKPSKTFNTGGGSSSKQQASRQSRTPGHQQHQHRQGRPHSLTPRPSPRQGDSADRPLLVPDIDSPPKGRRGGFKRRLAELDRQAELDRLEAGTVPWAGATDEDDASLPSEADLPPRTRPKPRARVRASTKADAPGSSDSDFPQELHPQSSHTHSRGGRRSGAKLSKAEISSGADDDVNQWHAEGRSGAPTAPRAPTGRARASTSASASAAPPARPDTGSSDVEVLGVNVNRKVRKSEDRSDRDGSNSSSNSSSSSALETLDEVMTKMVERRSIKRWPQDEVAFPKRPPPKMPTPSSRPPSQKWPAKMHAYASRRPKAGQHSSHSHGASGA